MHPAREVIADASVAPPGSPAAQLADRPRAPLAATAAAPAVDVPPGEREEPRDLTGFVPMLDDDAEPDEVD